MFADQFWDMDHKVYNTEMVYLQVYLLMSADKFSASMVSVQVSSTIEYL